MKVVLSLFYFVEQRNKLFMFNFNIHNFTKLFADDTVLTATNTTINTLTSATNIELEKIDNWMKLNKLTINYKKSQFMLISKKKNKIMTSVL